MMLKHGVRRVRHRVVEHAREPDVEVVGEPAGLAGRARHEHHRHALVPGTRIEVRGDRVAVAVLREVEERRVAARAARPARARIAERDPEPLDPGDGAAARLEGIGEAREHVRARLEQREQAEEPVARGARGALGPVARRRHHRPMASVRPHRRDDGCRMHENVGVARREPRGRLQMARSTRGASVRTRRMSTCLATASRTEGVSGRNAMRSSGRSGDGAPRPRGRWSRAAARVAAPAIVKLETKRPGHAIERRHVGDGAGIATLDRRDVHAAGGRDRRQRVRAVEAMAMGDLPAVHVDREHVALVGREEEEIAGERAVRPDVPHRPRDAQLGLEGACREVGERDVDAFASGGRHHRDVLAVALAGERHVAAWTIASRAAPRSCRRTPRARDRRAR